MESEQHCQIRFLGQSDAKRLDALRMIVSGRTASNADVDRRVADLLDMIDSRSLMADLLFGAFHGDRLICACMGVESPGRTVLVYVPPSPLARRELRVLPPLVQALRTEAWARGVILAQVLVAPDDAALQDALKNAGFELLAELVYLDGPVGPAPDVGRVRTDLRFDSYGPQTHDLFVRALDLSYVDSLDCPKLTGLRDTEDVLATHKAAGEFDPSLWFIARERNRLLGILLLSKVLCRPMLEVVYVGVSAGLRGQGVGDALLAHAMKQCVRVGASRLTLAVDGRNAPALGLYARWAFLETQRRRAWIAIDRKTGHR